MAVKIIAETCQNHNGSREILGEMIRSAADAGAAYVKSQIIFSDDVMYRERFENGIVSGNNIVKAIKRPYGAEVERLKKLDLTEDDHKWFIEECVRNNVIPITTIFSRRGIELASRLQWPESIVKVASPDIISLPFLRELCDVFDHLIISTGGAMDKEIEIAAELVAEKKKELTLLHCVSIYPNPLDLCNIARMKWLRKFADHVGFSDHTLVSRDGTKASKVAIAEGAEFIERHYTVLDPEETKDGHVSIGLELLRELVDFSNLENSREDKEAFVQMIGMLGYTDIVGTEGRELTHKEVLLMDYFRGRFGDNRGNKQRFNWEE